MRARTQALARYVFVAAAFQQRATHTGAYCTFLSQPHVLAHFPLSLSLALELKHPGAAAVGEDEEQNRSAVPHVPLAACKPQQTRCCYVLPQRSGHSQSLTASGALHVRAQLKWPSRTFALAKCPFCAEQNDSRTEALAGLPLLMAAF